MNLRRLTTLFLSAAIAVTAISMPSSTVYAEEGSWSETSTGVWSYTHADTSQDIPWLDVDITGVDWSTIEYVSADITINGEAAAAFGGDAGGEWYNCDPMEISDDTATIYLEPNGKVFSSLEINFDNERETTAGTVITISNINFSTEERDYTDVTDEWYQQNGSWYYRNGDTAVSEIPGLDIMQAASESIDWSSVKYISADIETTGTAQPVIDINFTGADDGWQSGSPNTVNNGITTVYYNTNGEEPVWSSLSFWQYEDGIALTADQLLTVSNITFSTEERDYSDVIGEWYEQNGDWHYTHGVDTTQVPRELDLLSLKPDDINWADVKYVSADITSDNAAFPVIGGNLTGEDDSWTTGSEKMLSEAGTVTAYLNTSGAEPTGLCVEFWHVDWDNNFAIEAGTNITVSNIVFSTEDRDYSDVIGEWYSPEDGIWCFRNGDRALAEGEMPSLDLNIHNYISDWSTVKYISAKVEVSGSVKAVMGGEYNGQWTDSAAVMIEDSSDIVMLYTEGKAFDYNNINFWNINETNEVVSANAVITVSEITVSETYPTDYTDIIGQWVKTDDGYYYNHGDKYDTAYVEGLAVDCPYDIADVQSISITAKVVMTGGTPESIKLVVTGEGKDVEWFDGYNFPFGADEETVVRKYRGNVVSNPRLDISFGQNDLAVIKNGGSVEIYVTDISYSVDPINILYSTPNDLLIDDNETDITGSDVEHDIMYHDISRIEKTGTLNIYTENIGSTQDIDVFWREWSDFSNITKLETTPVAVGDGVYEIRVTEEALKIIHEKAPKACELALTGTGYRFLKATFTPDSDAPAPVPEEIKPDNISDTDKDALEQSKDNIIDEYDAPDSADEFEYGIAHGHKSDRKCHDKHGWVYALRIVEKIDKDLLKHAENVTITVYSKKADQYITLTADTCFSYLNINGQKVKAGGKDAFITVILDGIPEDDEITFTSFNINYKK